MSQFNYTDFYRAVETSRAHAQFCEYAYGKNLCQHGFMTMEDMAFLVDKTGWSGSHSVLDVGCGNGRIAEALSDETGARLTGMDSVSEAIQSAQMHTRDKRERLIFFVGNLLQLPCAPHAFDALLSVDSLYFSTDYKVTLAHWASCVRAGGQLAIFFSCGADPEHPKATFDRATLLPESSELGVALRENGMHFQAWDFTASDYTLAKRKAAILENLRDAFEAEGNLFLYDNRMGETLGILDAIEAQMHARYLYLVRV
jgi:SAM-dependent methyltransferase